MFQSLNGFDPLKFLNIDNSQFQSEDEINQLRLDLNNKIGEYILLKLGGEISEDQINSILNSSNGEEVLDNLGKFTPNLEERVRLELENFKREYQGQ